jgi:hypothetical protein
MDWVVILLIIILVVLWSFGSSLGKIVDIISNIRIPQPREPESLGEIEEKLDNIYSILGGGTKMEGLKDRQRKELKVRLIKMLINQGSTPKQANDEAGRLIDEAEFAEKHEDYDIAWGKDFEGLERTVNYFEIEERHQKKYGHLLEKARNYLKGKTIIQPDEMRLGVDLGTDSYGQKWLIEKLCLEHRLIVNTKYEEANYEGFGGGKKLVNYEVVKPK